MGDNVIRNLSIAAVLVTLLTMSVAIGVGSGKSKSVATSSEVTDEVPEWYDSELEADLDVLSNVVTTSMDYNEADYISEDAMLALYNVVLSQTDGNRPDNYFVQCVYDVNDSYIHAAVKADDVEYDIYSNYVDHKYYLGSNEDKYDGDTSEDIFGVVRYKVSDDVVALCDEYLREYSGLDDIEADSINEMNCCYLIWWDDKGTNRFYRVSKDDGHLLDRGYYDEEKQTQIYEYKESDN